MARSKAHKFFNKFHSWTRHEGSVSAEKPAALEEFFVSLARIPEDAAPLVMSLFEDWFLFDRKLTRHHRTPLELFIEARRWNLPAEDLAVYEGFAKSNLFGFFRVEDAEAGRWMDLRAMPGGKVTRVAEETGSRAVERGAYLITRLIPFGERWAMSSFVCRMPEEASEDLDRDFGAKKGLAPGSLRPRQALSLFMPKVVWEREGLPRVRARLAWHLERWGGQDLTVSLIERAVDEAHAGSRNQPGIFQEALRKAPSASDWEELQELLTALWNLKIAECRPDLDPRSIGKGPIEMRLVRQLTDRVIETVPAEDFGDPQKAETASRSLQKAWLDAPQAELGGRTPREAILAERKSLGNPEERIGYRLSASLLDAEPGPVREGLALAGEALRLLIEGKARPSLERYAKAYPLLKGHPALHSVLGNMAMAHARLGNRTEALEALRAALKADPDYAVARKNLHLLETMSPEEFERLHGEGFFERTDIVNRGP